MSADGFYVSETMCKTCLRRDGENKIDSFHKQTSQSYISILTECVPIEVGSEEGLPKNICNKCVKTLLLLYKFRKMVMDNDNKVRRIFKENNEYLQRFRNNLQKSTYEFSNRIHINNGSRDITSEEFNSSHNLIENPNDITNHFQIVTYSESSSDSEGLLKEYETDKPVKFDKSEQSFQCEICGKVFNSKSNLKLHITKHQTRSLFSCNICDKTFLKPEAVLIHKRIHTGERPHKCLICSKAFIQYSALKTHLKTHIGVRSHVCSVCGKKFDQACSLVYHIRTHSTETPFVCEICQKGFKNKGSLTIHMRFHQNIRNYICQICNKRFVTSSYLKIHLRMHNDEKPHKCVVCGKSFLRTEHLKSHLVIHSGQKPYYCRLCPRRFTQNSHLKRHMKSHEQTVEGH